METLLFIFCLFSLYMILILIRNNIVFKHRIKAIDIIFDGKRTSGVDERKALYTSYPSYTIMVLFLIHAWTFNSLFPNLEEKLEKLENN